MAMTNFMESWESTWQSTVELIRLAHTSTDGSCVVKYITIPNRPTGQKGNNCQTS
jgi:hypothetical protein